MSEAAVISRRSMAFSATMRAYCAAFAVVGTTVDKKAIYARPPTASRLFLRFKLSDTVTASMGSLREYRSIMLR